MNKIICLGSNSKGNTYILEGNSGGKLIFEAGMPIMDISNALGHNYDYVEACLVSHHHGDHSKSIQKIIDRGISTFAPEETTEKFEGAFIALPKDQITTKSFNIYFFESFHDCECIGYIIEEKSTGETLLFSTDSYVLKSHIKSLNYLMIETNYREDELYESIDAGDTSRSRVNRLYQSHMSLEAAMKYIEEIDQSELSEIMLLHLSDNNSDEKEFKKIIENKFLINTTIMKKGVEVLLGADF